MLLFLKICFKKMISSWLLGTNFKLKMCKYFQYFHSFLNDDTVVVIFLKRSLCKFTWKTKPQKCIFEVWWSHNFSPTIVWRHIVINFDCLIVLVVPQEKLSLANVSITLLWAQSKKTSFRDSDDVIMTSRAPRPKLRLGPGSFLLSDT